MKKNEKQQLIWHNILNSYIFFPSVVSRVILAQSWQWQTLGFQICFIRLREKISSILRCSGFSKPPCDGSFFYYIFVREQRKSQKIFIRVKDPPKNYFHLIVMELKIVYQLIWALCSVQWGYLIFYNSLDQLVIKDISQFWKGHYTCTQWLEQPCNPRNFHEALFELCHSSQ